MPTRNPTGSSDLHGDTFVGSALDEGQQVGVDDVGLRCGHSVRVVLEYLQRRVFEELGREWPRRLRYILIAMTGEITHHLAAAG